MKKIQRRILIIFILLISAAYADIMPRYIDSIKNYGIGFTKVQSPLIIKKAPEKDAEVLEIVTFDYNNRIACSTNKNDCSLNKIFSFYLNEKKAAFMTTTDETQGYNLVCFNDKQALCGWVESKNNIFYDWNMFFNVLGRKYGLYAFQDISKNDRIIYASPDRNSNSTGSIEMPKYISPWLVQGNWVLVKIYEYDSKIKTGWLNYRGDDGKLRLFVKF